MTVSSTAPRRLPGGGWIALVGGGEFTFEETLDADAAWVEKTPPGLVGFVPAASGSTDYGGHFTSYMADVFEREAVTVPIYRPRDGRRGKNVERIEECAAVYLGGGVADHLLDALADSPAAGALAAKLGQDGVVVAIAAAAQCLGAVVRSIRIGETVAGLGWLPGGAVETNFDPGHDRRLRRMMQDPSVTWGLGIATGSAVLLGPDGAVEVVGDAWTYADPDAPAEPLDSTSDDN